ncbi:MAG: hypothetical protein SGILL_001706 [Bacillariaceae sp.]
MAFLFRKKKKTNDVQAALEREMQVDQPPVTRDQVDVLQNEVHRLNKRLVSMAAKVPQKSSQGSRPSAALGSVEEESHLVRGLPTRRNQALTRSEAAEARDSGHAGFKPSIAEIVVNKDSTRKKHQPVQSKWKSPHDNRSSSIASKQSLASSHGDGEVFYKDGKKYRRVVRMVQSTTTGANSSFRSFSSAHGREDINEGQVGNLIARYSMNSVTSEVSMNSRVSTASKKFANTKPTYRVHNVSDSYFTPAQNDNRKKTSNRIEPRPADPNPWMRNKMQRDELPSGGGRVAQPWTDRSTNRYGAPLQHSESHPSNARNREIDMAPSFETEKNSNLYGARRESNESRPRSSRNREIQMTSSFEKKQQFQAGLFNPSQEPEVRRETPSSRGKYQQVARPATKTFTPPEAPSFKQANAKHEVARMKVREQDVRPPPAMEESRPKPSQKREPKPEKAKEKRGFWGSRPAKPTKKSVPSKKGPPAVAGSARTPPVNLLKEIRKHDVKLTKVPANDPVQRNPVPPRGRASEPGSVMAGIRAGASLKQPTKTQGRPSDPGDLMAAIRGGVALQSPTPRQPAMMQGRSSGPGDLLADLKAGVALKKVDPSTIQAPKQQGGHMSELIAKLQKKKADALRREQENGGNETDW